MKSNRRKTAPQAALVPIGIALIIVGFISSKGLIGAGVLFLIIGIAAVARRRKSQSPEE